MKMTSNNVIKGFWEESICGYFNADVFVMPATAKVVIDEVEIELDRDDENHPACELLGAWDRQSIPRLLDLAKKWGVVIWDEGAGSPLKR